MDGSVRPLALAAALACTTSPRALAQPADIQGNALTITATSGPRSVTLSIPRSTLTQQPGTREWSWSSAEPLVFSTTDGASLGSCTATITYDPTFDNIFLALDLTAGGGGAGSAPTRFTARSADLANSISWPGATFMGSAHLFDRDGNGATLAGMFGGRCARLAWDGAPQANVLPGLTVAPGADAATAEPITLYSTFSGRESLALDLALSPNDFASTRISSIVSVPAPSAAALLALGMLAATRRTRKRVEE